MAQFKGMHKLVRQIGLAKQKLLFYLAYVKGGNFQVYEEFIEMFTKIRQQQDVGKKVREFSLN